MKKLVALYLIVFSVLSISCSPVVAKDDVSAKKLVVTIAWSKPDHGNGTHMYEEFSEKWKKVCEPEKQLTVETVEGFPKETQWEKSDLVILYMTNHKHDKKMNTIMKKHLERGASIMVLHQGLVVYKGDHQGYADNIGYSYLVDTSKYRRTALDSTINNKNRITKHLPKELKFYDEIYWNLIKGKKGKTTVLATCKFENDGDDEVNDWPLFWTTEHGEKQEKGRVFVAVVGHFSKLFEKPFFHNTLVKAMSWTLRQKEDAYKNLLINAKESNLKAVIKDNKISVFRKGKDKALLVHNVLEGMRPYIHPLMSPDMKDEFTQAHPGHHKHQTGLYWGFKQMDGMDYFHNPKSGIYLKEQLFKRTAIKVNDSKTSDSCSWTFTYDLRDRKGVVKLVEKQTWQVTDKGDHYILDLKWEGSAKTNLHFSKQQYGGLFLRMPWTNKLRGQATNPAGETSNNKMEQKESKWIDVGINLKGQADQAHITIMENPSNPKYPTAWRVDGQLGVGPCRSIKGPWEMKKGETVTFRHRLLVYSGKTNIELNNRLWLKQDKK